jgi:hypothetical protein
MASIPNPDEAAQLAQTIEMFEVITQSQPQDYQSLEILKEAYGKLGREADLIATSKRIAQAYVQMGQLSSAILEYETILQRTPDDAESKAALAQIESKASSIPVAAVVPVADAPAANTAPKPESKLGQASQKRRAPATPPSQVEDGRQAMYKIFVDGRHVSAQDFDQWWTSPDSLAPTKHVVEPFIQVLADNAIFPIEKSLRLLVEKCRVGLIPLEKYDIDIELARTFPADVCRRWCVLPFDRMSKSLLVATANPLNQQAARELSEVTNSRILWYVAPPAELVKNLRRAFH